jgi:hypothetical protein
MGDNLNEVPRSAPRWPQKNSDPDLDIIIKQDVIQKFLQNYIDFYLPNLMSNGLGYLISNGIQPISKTCLIGYRMIDVYRKKGSQLRSHL